MRARENDEVGPLMTVLGVNFNLGSLLSPYIGHVEQFPNAGHLTNFGGIVPGQPVNSPGRTDVE